MKETRSISCLFLLFIFLAIPATAFSQRRIIGENDYRKATSPAFMATSKAFPRRETRIVETFEGDELRQTFTETSEYLTERTLHITREFRKGDEVSIYELIQIESDLYCRENSDKWTKSDCPPAPPPPSPKTSEPQFTEEVVTLDGQKYTQYMVMKTFQGKLPNATTPTTYVREDKIRLNPDSTIYRRIVETYIESSKKVVTRQTFNFEYNAKINIKAPIK